jgi:hypothetical protein
VSARVVADMPEAEYHAHPALSATGAKKLLAPSTPAEFRDQLDKEVKASHFDVGHAVHKLVLGVGKPLVKLPGDDLRVKATAAAQQRAYEDGATPLKPGEYEQVHRMADAVQAHPLASALLSQPGHPEQSAFATHPRTGIDIRCRFDWLPEPDGGRLLIPDVKTAEAIDDESIAKAIEAYRYHMQGPWYMDLAALVGLGGDMAWLWVWVCKRPPYLVRVTDLDADDERQGRAMNEMAIDIYAHCKATGEWPGYPPRIDTIARPAWAQYRTEELIAP